MIQVSQQGAILPVTDLQVVHSTVKSTDRVGSASSMLRTGTSCQASPRSRPHRIQPLTMKPAAFLT